MPNGKDHRWTTDELMKFIALWQQGISAADIAKELDSTVGAIRHHVRRLRAQGVPLKRQKAGNFAGRRGDPWTQADIVYLVRRREEGATMESIAVELNRTFNAIQGMICRLRAEGFEVKRMGQGKRRLWDIEQIRTAVIMDNVVPIDRAKKAA